MKKFLISFGIVAAIVVSGWMLAYPTYSYHYRLTVEINTPDGVKFGSSVIEVTTHQYPRWITLGANSENTDITGEAVFVDLGDGRNVVMTMPSSRLAATAILNTCYSKCGYRAEWSKKLSEMLGAQADAVLGTIPMMLTFENTADPHSAKVLYKTSFYSERIKYQNGTAAGPPQSRIDVDRFAELFGEEYSLKRVWVRLTDAPITHDIENWLPWLDKTYRYVKVDAAKAGSDRDLALPKLLFIED